ncbi:thiol:disulfide interchange protein [Burkholderia lata]|uniref:Thiol:disulfide interchange protein n=1 Tax=Burkholderia lata (strain ATCC 17760 / DSM 23089 / LMG 22485 / NCIMB 9086 / R18194 / 383) TaxID=482957 RepID=A0A6P2TZT5_BURL3|nr:DsbC family protein [Burkholderia lata]VWC62538.1 thiol:disulfide interchange protein [Burkholderia lata]
MSKISKSLTSSLLPFALAAICDNAQAFQEDHLKQILQAKVPELEIGTVSRSPISGLYEIVANSRIFYSNSTGTFILVGDMIDTSSQENLTETRFNKMNSEALRDLPIRHAIKIKNGSGKRVISTFFDPNCSFCKKMSPELDKIPDATIYIFLYPVLSPDSVAISGMILCADDPSLAWRTWVKKGRIARLRTSCPPDVTKELLSLGKKLGIKGTPTTFLPSGKRVEGFVSGKELADIMEHQ